MDEAPMIVHTDIGSFEVSSRLSVYRLVARLRLHHLWRTACEKIEAIGHPSGHGWWRAL